MTNKKNHHFVPQAMLRNWYSKDLLGKDIEGFKKIKRRYNGSINFSPKNTPSKSVCSKDYLYALHQDLLSSSPKQDTNSLEDYFQVIDNNGSLIIQKIIEKGNLDNLTEKNYQDLYKFLLALHFRYPEQIDKVKSEVQNITHTASSIKWLQNTFDQAGIAENYTKLLNNFILTTMREVLEDNNSYKNFRSMELSVVSSEHNIFFSGERPFIADFKSNNRVLNFGFVLALSPKVLLIGMTKKLIEQFKQQEQHLNFIAAQILSYNQKVCEQSSYIISWGSIEDKEIKDMVEKYLKDDRDKPNKYI